MHGDAQRSIENFFAKIFPEKSAASVKKGVSRPQSMRDLAALTIVRWLNQISNRGGTANLCVRALRMAQAQASCTAHHALSARI